MSDLEKLAERYRAAFDRTKQGRAEWIKGTMELAAVVLEARKLMPSNAEFGNWLAKNGLDDIAPNDRSALLGFAKHPDEMRLILERTTRFSWQHIWMDETPKEWKELRLTQMSKTTSSLSYNPKKKAAIRRGAIAERQAEVLRKNKEFVSGTLKGLTAEEIGEPELANDPRMLREKYGPVRILTKTQVEENASIDRIQDWIKLAKDAQRFAAAEIPEDLYEWAERPGKRQKLERWLAALEPVAGIIAQIRSRLSGAPVEVKRTA
jgi:hypothetical protein